MNDAKKTWEFYEELNEIVYAADADTHQILYLNRKAREVFSVPPGEDGQGQLCYRLFHGRTSPCPTCNNPQLVPGRFLESVYFSALLGRTYALKDTLLEADGRRIRLELAIGVNTQEQRVAQGYLNNEAILNEALRLSLSAPDPDEGINLLLAQVGKALRCDRMYLFEAQPGPCYRNTYVWCAPHASPQIQDLQQVSAQALAQWMPRFQQGKTVVITDMAQVKEQDPLLYRSLAPQGVRTLVAGPLTFHGKVFGFYGVDDPPAILMENIHTLFQIMGHFLVSLLRRRDLLRNLESMSRRDQMTGCGNRHGLEEFLQGLDRSLSIGAVYCDVTGLKRLNDSQGHQAGDELLRRASGCLRAAFPQDPVFRIGGDEFLVLSTGGSQEELAGNVALLRREMAAQRALMAVGWVWYPACPTPFDQVLSAADAKMYEEKKRYYADKDRDRRKR
jgi:diguanylate cyclase (GGDEF)-like protein